MKYEMMRMEYGVLVSRSAETTLGADGRVSVFEKANSSIIKLYRCFKG